MSIPKKGTRKIIVEQEPFIWLIRRQATNMQADYPEGCLHVAVEHALEPGSTLIIETDRLHPQGYTLVGGKLSPLSIQTDLGEIKGWEIERKSPLIPVKPSDVALWIKQAMQMGWLPQKSGISFTVRVTGKCLEKI
ncbi:MAG: hypothetical protein KME17_17090 [Cyanosarcina radialis HA8281-LM2]|jgi:hypothetical protein|nr:hypothetical protein [Cyanosarcina radialis HA8281-LM2]